MTKRIVLLQALASTSNDLALMVRGVDDASSDRRPAGDQWSIADVVNHLVDVEERYRRRLQRVLKEEKPRLPYMHPDEQAHDPQVSLSTLLDRFKEERSKTMTFLKEIGPGDWQRRAVHESKGDVTLRFLVQYLVDHDIQHLNQIVEIQQQLRMVPVRNPQPTIDTG